MTSCYDKALGYLAMREHSERELEVKLSQKGYKSSDIKDTLSSLKEEGYLSDERFASAFISSRMRKMPEGRHILMMRLMEKGVSRETARCALDQYFEENGEEIKDRINSYSEKIIARKGEEKGRSFLMKKGILKNNFHS